MGKLSLNHVAKTFNDHNHQQTVLVDVNMEMESGKVTGLIGRSGSGKSTMINLIMQLEPLTSGQISFDGIAIKDMPIKEFYDKCQVVFQNPSGSLNPSWTVRKSLEEPLKNTGRKWSEYEDYLLQRVGLSKDLLDKRPRQISGGQQQRVNLVRALFMRPEVLICDEVVSALDRVNQHQLVHLLLELQDELNLTILFISHDIQLVDHMSDSIYHLKDGKTEKIK